jgi:hypothetical protein
MWLASIVEDSGDALMKNLHGIITSWDKGAERLSGYLGHRQAADHLAPRERQYEDD